jgi:RNA recognition motif-containing protein
MPRKLYVANLSHIVGGDELGHLFAGYGAVRSAVVLDPRRTADSAGVGLVEMESHDGGDAAIAALHGSQHRGLMLAVSWAGPGQGTGINLSHMFESMNMPE